ncbi:MAG: CRISPR-associated protein Cas4 [Nitrospirae bacterium]|nr:CRISPR-associated protein Cas4 [Nitrospirota bacterium]
MNGLAITGTEFNYFHVCKRKLWLFSHDIEMEQESDIVFLGRLIHEHSYQRERKEVLIDGVIRIDFMDDDTVHEVKKSNRMEESHVGQVLYYIYCLRLKGVDVRRGVINYPKQRRTTEVELTPDREREIRKTIECIEEIKRMKSPPAVLNSRICRKCSYEEFCYS